MPLFAALPALLAAALSTAASPAPSGSPAALPLVAPASAGMSAAVLGRIDAAVAAAIARKDAPGAVVLVGRRGRVVFRRAYGQRALVPAPETMTVDTVFDMASLTKILATSTSVMALVEAGKLRLEEPVARYLPDFAAGGGGRAEVTVEELLTHRGGLRAGRPDGPLHRHARRDLRAQVPPAARARAGRRFSSTPTWASRSSASWSAPWRGAARPLRRARGLRPARDGGHRVPAAAGRRRPWPDRGRAHRAHRDAQRDDDPRDRARPARVRPRAASPATPASSRPPTTSRATRRRSWRAAARCSRGRASPR